MKFERLFSRVLIAALASLAITGCRSGSKGTGAKNGDIETYTGLPYYPPGPVYMIDPPPGFVSTGTYATPLTAVPQLKVEQPPLQTPIRPFQAPQATNEWIVAANKWIGTPYQLGGQDKSGIDCSAYAAELYREVAKTAIPRTTAEQWASSQALGIAGHKPGDLLFFSTLAKGTPGHVGVYVGDRMFTHSGTSTGVTYSSLDDNYWSSRFMGARRPKQ